MTYGIRINFKQAGPMVIVLGEPYEYRKQTPFFALWDEEQRASHLMDADGIRTNWNAWVKDLLPQPEDGDEADMERTYERITMDEAGERGVEVL